MALTPLQRIFLLLVDDGGCETFVEKRGSTPQQVKRQKRSRGPERPKFFAVHPACVHHVDVAFPVHTWEQSLGASSCIPLSGQAVMQTIRKRCVQGL